MKSYGSIIIKSFLLCLLHCIARANDIESNKEFYTAKKSSNPIVLDGNLAEWTRAAVLVDPRFSIPKGSGAAGTLVSFEAFNGGTWTGPDDHTSDVRVLYDDESVYFGFVVTDDYHENSANSAWNGDSVQLMVANAARDTQVALYNYSLGGIEEDLGGVILMVEAGPGGTTAVVKRDVATKRTTYEIKLPKASIGLQTLTTGVQFGLGMAINDGDQDTPGQRGWGGLGAHALVFGKTPSETALITLEESYIVTTEPSTHGVIGGGGEYVVGTTATLTAVPAAGYVFTGWTGGASGVQNPLVMTVTQDQTIGATFSQMGVQPVRWESATRSASPNGSNSSLLPWTYSEPVVVGLSSLPWEDPPTDTLARHYSVFDSLGVDIGLSAHNGLRGGRFTGGEGRADFRATFVVEETTSVTFMIDSCYATSLSSGDVTALDVRLSLTREGNLTNLVTCVASASPQIISLVPGRYELLASVHPKERSFQQTWSLLSLSMKALVDPPVPPVLPRELMAPQLEMAGEFIRVVVPESVVGRRYQLQTSVSTLAGSWVDVGLPRTGDGSPMVIQIPHDAGAGQKFFRLKFEPR